MKRNAWLKRITEATRQAGTYKPYFDAAMETLAGILEKRDEAEKYYKESGAVPIVEHTNKGGATNMEQNPALRLINDLNTSALQYWRELGLTPSGLNKINANAVKETEESGPSLVDSLRSRIKVG